MDNIYITKELKNMKTYKDLTESSTLNKKLKELNTDRVGKTVLDVSGKEVDNSLVLSKSTYVTIDNNDMTIETYPSFGSEQKIYLTKSEFELLKKLKF